MARLCHFPNKSLKVVRATAEGRSTEGARVLVKLLDLAIRGDL
jgi:hypothetical protein